MIVLGINGGFRLGYQDISAALAINGKIIAAVEEERLNRIKHSPGQLPFLAIKEVLNIAGIKFGDIDIIATHGETWGNEFPPRIRDYFCFNFGQCPSLQIYHHHDCHAASTYYASGFKKAMVVTLDSSGDGISLQLAVGENQKIKVVKRIARPDSLGIFYSLITQFCGFQRDSDEYKLMGLASYGNKTAFDFNSVISYSNKELKLNTEYIKAIAPGQPQPTRQERLFTEKFEKVYGEHRLIGAAMSDFYMDIAASAQYHFENILVDVVTDFYRETGIGKICLAGGGALNCAANKRIANLNFIEEIFVQPASSDAGISVGAAYLASVGEGITCQPMDDVYLGTSYSNDNIQHLLQQLNLSFKIVDDPSSVAAKHIAEGKVIGWLSGRMELGPRALGGRSILANPAAQNIQQIVNQKIKFREGFRPFCPSVLEEESPIYFKGRPTTAPFMTINFDVQSGNKEKIKGIVHIDNTARVQTVSPTTAPQFHSLIKALKDETGTGVVLNTSFNRSNEPIVNSPVDAVSCFYGSGLDYLFLENFVLSKG